MHQPDMENDSGKTQKTSLAAQVVVILFSHIKQKALNQNAIYIIFLL